MFQPHTPQTPVPPQAQPPVPPQPQPPIPPQPQTPMSPMCQQSDPATAAIPDTPVTAAKHLLRQSGISPRQAPTIVRELSSQRPLINDLNEITPRRRSALLSGCHHTKRARCVRLLSKHLSLDRRAIAKRERRGANKPTKLKYMAQKQNVIAFMTRVDNCTVLPGKKDVIKVKKEKKQKCLLNDCLHLLHATYNSETPDSKVSLSFFVKSRPKYCIPVKFVNRKICLCQRDQNFALKLRAVRSVGFDSNPDAFCDNVTLGEASEVLKTMESSVIKFEEWRKQNVPYGERTVKRICLVKDEVGKDEFVKKFVNEMEDFKAHSRTVKAQSAAVRTLKANMPLSHVTVQMDYAENYSCSYGEEIQSAYYNKEQITLHPMVVHYREQGDNDRLQHKCCVGVSAERSHTAPTTYAFINKVLPEIKHLVPDVSTVHYLTDSPTSQYRNKHIINLTAQHEDLFNVAATWQYF